MTETIKRIRWDDAPAGQAMGYVGTLSPCVFRIWEPEDGDSEWLLTAAALPGEAGKRLHDPTPDALKAEAERWLERFVSSLGAVFPEEPGEPEKPRGKPRTELDGYRPYHAADCPARTSYHGHECTCGGLEHPLWKPGDEPAVHAGPVPPHPEEETGR